MSRNRKLSKQERSRSVKPCCPPRHYLSIMTKSKELVLSCDSSSYGNGCALLQTNGTGNLQPVAYTSQTRSDTECRPAQVEREALACVWGTLKIHQYVFGRRVTIETDHKPLLGLRGETRAILPTSSVRIQRWALTLGSYDYSLVYCPGKEM